MNKSNKSIIACLSDFLDWLDIEKGLSPKSQENYSRFIGKFFIWLKLNNLEFLKPHDLSSEHIWKYRAFLARKNSFKIGDSQKKFLKKSSQNYYLIALRSLLNYFAQKDILSLPAEKVRLARNKGDRQVRFLNIDQLKKLFSAIDINNKLGLRDRAIVETLFSTGLRVAELVNLNKNQIKIDFYSQNKEQNLELSITGKGGRSRTIYFSYRSLNWLIKYLKTRSDDDPALFINYRSRYQNNNSRRLTSRSVEKIIKKYALMAGLPINTTPHVMRHSFATDLLSQGVDLRAIQEFLGHKDISATQIYAHITSKKLREIHKKFHSDRFS